MGESRFAELDALKTEELRDRAFALARERRDVAFFWNLFRHLPHAQDIEQLDDTTGAVALSIEDAIGLWRELTGHGYHYGEAEPLLRAAFIDYLTRDRSPGQGSGV